MCDGTEVMQYCNNISLLTGKKVLMKVYILYIAIVYIVNSSRHFRDFKTHPRIHPEATLENKISDGDELLSTVIDKVLTYLGPILQLIITFTCILYLPIHNFMKEKF